MRQQFLDPAVRMCGQMREHVLQIGVGVVSIEFGGLDQAHDSCRAFAGTHGACKQPILSPHRDRPDLLFNVIVIDGHSPIVEVARQCRPAL